MRGAPARAQARLSGCGRGRATLRRRPRRRGGGARRRRGSARGSTTGRRTPRRTARTTPPATCRAPVTVSLIRAPKAARRVRYARVAPTQPRASAAAALTSRAAHTPRKSVRPAQHVYRCGAGKVPERVGVVHDNGPGPQFPLELRLRGAVPITRAGSRPLPCPALAPLQRPASNTACAATTTTLSPTPPPPATGHHRRDQPRPALSPERGPPRRLPPSTRQCKMLFLHESRLQACAAA